MAAFCRVFYFCQSAFAQHELALGLLFFPPLMTDVFRVHDSEMNQENQVKGEGE